MKNNLHVGNLGPAATGNNLLELAEPLGAAESFQVLKHRGSNGFTDARIKSECMTPMLPEEMRRSMNRQVTPDLRSNCPICGNPYQPGEGILALACLSFAISVVPSSPPAAHGDPVILGHHGCVLPRLLTLLAAFQPEVRFVEALTDFSAGQSAFLEPPHDEPRAHDCICSLVNQP